MKYFVFDNERESTNYHEFYKGKWDGKTFWHPESISIDDNVLYANRNLVDAIIKVIPTYDPFDETEINREQWIQIGELITDPQSREVYDEAAAWLSSVWDEYGCFTILGL